MEWIGAADAAKRLGVKPATLYAYVSRGVLKRRRAEDGRTSLFDPAEIEELARRGRPRRPPAPAELVIESAVTALGDGRPYYRGRDVAVLAAEWSFEEVAWWLWTGEHGDQPDWTADPATLEVGRTAQAALPMEALPLERLQVIAAALAATDPLRFHLDPPAVTAAGQSLIAGLVDCLPGAAASGRSGEQPSRGQAAPPDHGIAERLWPKLSARTPEPELLRALQAALVLLADHELAASTLAVRVAASVRADPYAVVTTGLGALGGALHGGASLGAETMLAEAGRPGDAARVVGERLRRGERIPGLGHGVYKAGDQRFTLLFEMVRAAAPERLAVAEAILREAKRRRLPGPNIDFALAALAGTAGMIKGAGEVIFAVARTAGWIAHAMEEYAHGTPLRPRASYIGAAPGEESSSLT